ncbi:DUF2231 domain-containing protein [Mycolicibacterium sp.]|uniref:DUF2231 domain-containing protein n=1 Tax=Mycolicibacterium sp. TaxID=2320850 RepID=UPI001D1F8CDB|nr:DUF2231 domain-containing protein [Mycolicibacterium sp.]MCB1292015.1 hypothetical protein [Mycobacterium sp.]MCB9410377.1 hypothetical protein [Mycolicibacterium sp.]
MSTFNGLPAHPLLVHFIVVLTPLTAILAILCAVWPAARQRLVWLTLALAGATAVLTPIAAEAGEWLEHRVEESAALETHEHLGKTMIYFSLALLVAAVLLVIGHVRTNRDKALSTAWSVVIAVFVLIASVAATVQVLRIGHSGAEATWGDVVTTNPSGGGEEDHE